MLGSEIVDLNKNKISERNKFVILFGSIYREMGYENWSLEVEMLIADEW